MAEAETLVKVLEGMIAGQTQLGDMIRTVHERAEANDLIIARLVESQGQSLQAIMQALERIVSTTDRTERMTAEVLARLATTQGSSH